VSAVPDSWRYRAGKFVRRHRIALGAAAALMLVIVGGAGAAVYEARRALREEAVARQRFDMVRHLANAVVFEFNDALQNVPGTTAARKLIVARAVEYLDNLTQQEAADVSLARELAAAYTRIGDVLGNPYRPNLGDSAGALTSYRRAVDLFERLERRDPSADTRQGHADAYIGLGSLLWSNGDAEGARSNFRRALTIYEDLLRVEPRFLRNTAAVAYYLGQTELRFGDARQASLYYTRAQHDLESWLASNADDFVAKRTLALTFMKLADVAHLLGDDDDAAENYRQASKALDAMLAAQSSSLDIQRLAATAWLRLADLDGAVPSAEREAFARRAARVLQPLADSDPSNAQAVGDWASAERVLAASLADERRDAEAEAAYGIAVNAFERVLSTNPGYIETRRELGELYYHRGVLALRRSGPRASLEQFTHARALLEAPDVEHQVPRVLADLYALTGDAYEAIARQGERAAESTAIDWYKKSDAKWTAMAGQQRLSHNDAQRQEEVTHKLASASGRMPPPATK
jgi:non-specific serine/threonine protein kinase/serine/threonine-protein kinase